jgi:outer membrane murein-binding lipoprotein Lpp
MSNQPLTEQVRALSAAVEALKEELSATRDDRKAWEDEALKAKAERDEARAAIEATRRLASSLNEAAEGGAGFDKHWGERVLQVTEPLRNVSEFRDRTLTHNQMLLESNGEFMRDRDAARAALQLAADDNRKLRAELDQADTLLRNVCSLLDDHALEVFTEVQRAIVKERKP